MSLPATSLDFTHSALLPVSCSGSSHKKIVFPFQFFSFQISMSHSAILEPEEPNLELAHLLWLLYYCPE